MGKAVCLYDASHRASSVRHGNSGRRKHGGVCGITRVIHMCLSRNIWHEGMLGRDESDEVHSLSSRMSATEKYPWCQRGAIASMSFN